jgi:hypothetical protein
MNFGTGGHYVVSVPAEVVVRLCCALNVAENEIILRG